MNHRMLNCAASMFSAMLLILGASAAEAVSYPDSLWIGNNSNSSFAVLNIDKTGAVLRSDPNPDVTGFAINLAANTIYYGSAFTTPQFTPEITPHDLGSLAVNGATFSSLGSDKDMTFDGTSIWRVGSGGLVQKFNPSTGAVLFSFVTGFADGSRGIAWDGSNLWISHFLTDEVVQFTPAGVPTGNSFVAGSGCCTGGLAWDTTDGTMWVGQFGQIFHYTTSGLLLGALSLPDGRFVDGLEYQGVGTVPEPSSLALLGGGLIAFLGWAARARPAARRTGQDVARLDV
jgi:hypothetical protein